MGLNSMSQGNIEVNINGNNNNINIGASDQDTILLLIIIILINGTPDGDEASQEGKASLLSKVDELIELYKLKQLGILQSLTSSADTSNS